MTDFSKFIEYERTHTVELRDPITGEGTGIKFGVVSSDSKRVVDGLRGWQAGVWERRREAGGADLTDKERLAFIDEHTVEELVHAIVTWDFGKHSWGRLSGSGEPSEEDRRYFAEHENSGWAVAQLAAAVKNIGNFMQPLPRAAPRGSKKT